MKTRILLLSLMCLLMQVPADAQSASSFYKQPYRTRNIGTFSRDHQLLSFSYGFPNYLYGSYNYYGIGGGSRSRLGFGPIMARYEMALRDEVGLSFLGQAAVKTYRNGDYRDNAMGLGFAVMGNYHFNKLIPVPKLDVYVSAGPAIEFRRINYDNDYPFDIDDESDVNLSFYGTAGARYYFNPGFAVFGELGYTGFSSLNLGVTLRF